MSLISRQIPEDAAAQLAEAVHIQVVDSGLFDLSFYQWLLARVRKGVVVELVLTHAAQPESTTLSPLYFKHFSLAGGRLYASPSTATTSFLLTDDVLLLPETQGAGNAKAGFRQEENAGAVSRYKALFEHIKAGSSIKSLGTAGAHEAPATEPPPKPIEIRFSASPSFVQVNQRFELSWDVRGAERVYIEPLLGEVPAKGQRALSAEQNTEFRLEAENHATRLTATATVTIDPRPKIEYVLSVPTGQGDEEIILSPIDGMPDHFGVVKGSPLRLYWRCYNAETCSLDEHPLPLNGNMMLAPETLRLYRLRAAGPQGSTETTLVMEVLPRPEIVHLNLPATTPIAVDTVLNLNPGYKAPTSAQRPIKQRQEIPVTPKNETPQPLGIRIRNFCWFCAGADPELLSIAPASERAKYAGIGGAVFFTGLLAALSGGYALFTAFENWPAAVLFGLIWGALIFNLDRLIVASMKKEAGGRNPWLQALPRFLLAGILSLVIAKPLELRIFKPEIDGILAEEKREKTIRIEALYEVKLRKINERITGIKTETESLFTLREQLYQEYRCECDGTCGTGRVGRGSECARKEAKYRQADAEYQALKTENDRLIAAARSEAANVDIQKKTELMQWSATRSDGLVARLEASGKLPFLPGLFIILLILMVEIAPVLSKLLTPAGAYEHATRLAETRFVISQEELAQQDQELLDRQSAMRVRLHTEELNQAVEQKAAVLRLIADAQLKLVKDQVDAWLEEERGKRG
jgi:hypothetical protein